MSELTRRFDVDVEALRRRNDIERLYSEADRKEVLTFAPLRHLSGSTPSKASDQPLVQVDYRGGQLSATLPGSSTWVSLEKPRRPLGTART
jgi:hypothetical protein